jgi:hypothetical protein
LAEEAKALPPVAGPDLPALKKGVPASEPFATEDGQVLLPQPPTSLEDPFTGATAEDIDAWLWSDADEPLKKSGGTQGSEAHEWTPAFSMKVWDHWKNTDPDFYGQMLDMAQDELLQKGILKQSGDGKVLGPSGAALNMSKDGSVAMVKHWAAQHLPPDFFHTELGLPNAGPVDESGKFILAPLDDYEPFDPASWSAHWKEQPDAEIKKRQSEAARRPAENIRDYVARLRKLANEEEMRAPVAGAVQSLESDLQKNLSEGRIGHLDPQKPYTQDYIDYLAAHGVDQRTLDDIASGELSMDPKSRMARAEQHGLDPKAIWFRWDTPLKDDMKGFTGAALAKPELRRYKGGQLKFIDLSPSKEGLVYTSHSPDYAKKGVQMPLDEVALYPFLGPSDGIAGLDELPPQAYATFAAKQAEALRKKYPDSPRNQRDFMRSGALAEQLVHPNNWEPYHTAETKRASNLAKLRRVEPGADRSGLADGTLPSYPTAEARKEYTEPLMASGAKGTLVKDETGLSTAFTPAGARMLRRADLAPLDTRFKQARNILQSLLLPAAIAAGASQSQPGVLSGLTEDR